MNCPICNEYGISPDSHEYDASEDRHGETIHIRDDTKNAGVLEYKVEGGTLRVEPQSNGEAVARELFVDFISDDDGLARQVAVIGTSSEDGQNWVHSYLYDGEHEFSKATFRTCKNGNATHSI